MDKKITIQEFADRVDREGDLAYAICHYFVLDRIEDGELRALCHIAKEALARIEVMIAPYSEGGATNGD